MAANYVVTSQEPSTQVLGPNEVLSTMTVGFVTSPHGVRAYREVPRTAWASGGAAAWIAPLATAIENLIDGGLASGASFVQDIDPATGLLTDAIEFVVSYDPPPPALGPMTATAVVPVDDLTLDTSFGSFVQGADPAQTLRDAYDQLVATAKL